MSENIPRLNRCIICGKWYLEKDLGPIEVPDQTGYIQKLGCQGCIDSVINKGRGRKLDTSVSGVMPKWSFD